MWTVGTQGLILIQSRIQPIYKQMNTILANWLALTWKYCLLQSLCQARTIVAELTEYCKAGTLTNTLPEWLNLFPLSRSSSSLTVQEELFEEEEIRHNAEALECAVQEELRLKRQIEDTQEEEGVVVSTL